jgi:hypothetical protein
MKESIGSYDDSITSPFILAIYNWNMMFNPDPSIKGDYTVRAQGVSSLMAKEWLGQQLMQLSALTANPLLAETLNIPVIMRGIATAMDLPKELIKSDEEIDAARQAQQQLIQQQQEISKQQAQLNQQHQRIQMAVTQAESERTAADTARAHAQTAKTLMEAAHVGSPQGQIQQNADGYQAVQANQYGASPDGVAPGV